VVLDRQRAQTKIERIRFQPCQRVRGQAGLEIDLQLRMAGLQHLQDRRQRVHQHGHAGADANAAATLVGEAAHRRAGAGVLIQQMPRVLDQLLACLREMRALADSFHQSDVEPPFQLLHLMRHRRLRQVQLLGRRREAAACHDFNEGPELIEIETAHRHNDRLSFQ
jgi:hypothetical protein